ncbi:MAG: hypothetical protein KDC12_10465 [Flavobacteriales bacterium]|nr:hypothetical protein [Flavobacteriales bacterium]
MNLLSGNWEDLSEGGAKVELWTSVGDQHLKGKGVVLTGMDTTCIETLEIKIVDDTLRYLVRIPGQSDEYAVVFTLGSQQGNTLIFENKKYPFPQYIVYELKSQVELRTAIEGRINGEFRKEEFWLMRKDAQE